MSNLVLQHVLSFSCCKCDCMEILMLCPIVAWKVLHHCLKLADTNRDGTLNFQVRSQAVIGYHIPDALITWQEFERFLKNLRKPKHPTDHTFVKVSLRIPERRQTQLQFYVQELALLYMNMFDADPDS